MVSGPTIDGLIQDIDSYIKDKKEFSFVKGVNILYTTEHERPKSLFWHNVDFVLDKYNMRKSTGCSSYIAKEYALKALVYQSACK